MAIRFLPFLSNLGVIRGPCAQLLSPKLPHENQIPCLKIGIAVLLVLRLQRCGSRNAEVRVVPKGYLAHVTQLTNIYCLC
jgi:hypothetical protein